MLLPVDLFCTQARAPKASVPNEDDDEDDAAIQAEVQAMLDSIKRKGEDTASDDDSESDAEADALRYSEIEATNTKGKDSVAAMLDAGVDDHDIGEDVELAEAQEVGHTEPAKARSAKKAAPVATPSSSMWHVLVTPCFGIILHAAQCRWQIAWVLR